MGVKEYNILFNVLFWIKTFIAISCGLGGLAYFGYEIYGLRLRAIGTPFIDFGSSISSDLSSLVPPSPYVYLGFSIDWRFRDPSKINLDGKKPLIYDYTMPVSVPDSSYNSDLLKIYAKNVRKAGAMLQITIIPDTTDPILPLNSISDMLLSKIASDCLDINNMGVPVFLNYAPNMNTNFHKYKLSPVAYKLGFQAMSNKLKEIKAKFTLMVWTPYVGYDYPNIGGAFNNLENQPPITLDTNEDGKLDPADDPYGPYYPGDEYVDWVGLANNWVPEAIKARMDTPAGYFEGCMNGNNDFIAAIQTGGTQVNLDFYGRFSNQRKPMILSQVGIAVQKDSDQDSLKAKSPIWKEILSIPFLNKFANLKGVVITEKEMQGVTGTLDFRILEPPTYRSFVDHISQDVRTYLPFIGILRADKNGKIQTLANIP